MAHQNRHDILSDDSDFFNTCDDDRIQNPHYVTPPHGRQRSRIAHLPSPIKPKPTKPRLPKNILSINEDHSYAGPVTSSPGYKSAIGEPPDGVIRNPQNDIVSPSIVFKFIYNIFDIYFNSHTVQDSLVKYEEQCLQFLNTIKNSH